MEEWRSRLQLSWNKCMNVLMGRVLVMCNCIWSSSYFLLQYLQLAEEPAASEYFY